MMSRIALFMVVCWPLVSQAESESQTVGQALQKWLSAPPAERPPLNEQDFAKASLTKEQAAIANELLWKDHMAMIRSTREAEMEKKAITLGEETLRFDYKTFGSKPSTGRSLYISMHGGGNTRPAVNDRQWKNQIGLYKPKEGIYLAPRAPTDTWNLWHRSHIDPLFDRLIENLIVLEEVDPNKVYLMGYSAGGDGVYQLAPRMADRFAAASMMAGHPNETKPDGLRNIGFALHMGENDGAYKRNEIAAQWKESLAELRKQDPEGYVHDVQIHQGKGHWMEKEDAVALPWMAKFTRNPHPKKVVWLQDDTTHSRFYWLALPADTAKKGQRLVASVDGQTITIEGVKDCDKLTVLLTDALLDLNEEVTVKQGDRTLFQGKVSRTVQDLAETLAERPDPTQQYWARVSIDLDA